uniref:EGF-like domain-containing protein n=1 Tax=Macrostomum lignano TaxID=282301 RepID=A0A1I8FN35_9PLAT
RSGEPHRDQPVAEPHPVRPVRSKRPTAERDFHHGTVANQPGTNRPIWSGKLTISATCYLLINVSLPYQQVVGLYLRRNSLPTAVRHDFFHRLVNVQSQKKPHALAVVHLAQPAVWYRVAYQRSASFSKRAGNAWLQKQIWITTDRLPRRLPATGAPVRAAFATASRDSKGRTARWRTQCRCAAAMATLTRARVCRCHPQWKGADCSVPWTECLDPLCSGNGRCVAGQCQCSAGSSLARSAR